MEYNPQRDIANMMRAYGQEVKGQPEIPDEKTRVLRARLMFEEVVETIVKGLGVSISVENGDEQHVISDMNGLTFRANLEPDLIQLADGVGDTLVVTYGTANAAGLSAPAIMTEITRSNMSKVHGDGTVKRDEFGKVVKPASYSPADIAKVIGVKAGS